MDKFKIGIVGVAGLAILVLIGAYFQARMRGKDEALVEQTARVAQLEAENERLSNLVASATSSAPQRSEPSRELLRLRGEVGVLRQQTDAGDHSFGQADCRAFTPGQAQGRFKDQVWLRASSPRSKLSRYGVGYRCSNADATSH